MPARLSIRPRLTRPIPTPAMLSGFLLSSYRGPRYLHSFPTRRSSDLFIQEPPSGDLQERVLIRHHDYDQCFQSVQLLQWNSQVKFNVTVYRNLPTTRDSIMTS